MKISDLLIIYFSIGAPLAVRVYFQKSDWRRGGGGGEKSSRIRALWAFLFWIPEALRFFRERKFLQKFLLLKNGEKEISISRGEKILDELQKRLEKIASASHFASSIFETRELFARYVGLTLAAQSAPFGGDGGDGGGEINTEFFRAAGRDVPKSAAKCFYRRNRLRLLSHQTRARTDFLKLCGNLFAAADSDAKEFVSTALEFVEVLNDAAARGALEKMFAEQNSPEKRFLEKPLEKDLWKPQIHKLSPLPTAANLISTVSPLMRSTAAASTTGLRKED